MKRILILLAGLWLSVPTAWAAKSFHEYQQELLSQNKSKVREERLSRDYFPDRKLTAGSSIWYLAQPSSDPLPLADFKVNQDNFASTYPQSNPRVAVFPNRYFFTVWEETRNGDMDVFGQRYDSSGAAIGSNFRINQETGSVDQFQPDVGVDLTGKVVVVWMDNDSLDIIAQRLDSNLTVLGSAIKVNTGPANSAIRPAVAVAPSGAFAIVWEDLRSGYDIYGQFYDAGGSPMGVNFKINSDFIPALHLAPRAEYDGSGNLVVTWEDYRDGDGDIYFQRFDSTGAPVDTNMLVTPDSTNEDQYLPDVDRSFDGRFQITYVDTRDGTPDIYVRRFSNAGAVLAAALKVNGDAPGISDHWDPAVGTDSLNRFAVTWADYRNEPTIYAQNYDASGTPVGANLQISALNLTQERNSPAIDRHHGGNYCAIWQDHRGNNFDIWGQRLSSAGALPGINFKVNDDVLGAFQRNPAIATKANGNLYVAWEDYRAGNADVYLRAFDRLGNALISDTKVSVSDTSADQTQPDISVDGSGNILVTWLETGTGTKIMGQFYNSGLSPIDVNFGISDDTGSVIHNRPACAATSDGKFMVVWSDDRNGVTTQNIYGKVVDLPFFPIGPFPPNFKINDDISSLDHLNPRVGADSGSTFAVAWQDQRTGLPRIYWRGFGTGGSALGASQAIASDSSGTVQYQPDVAVAPGAQRAFTWLEDRGPGTFVLAQTYNSSGIALGPNLVIADTAAHGPSHPRIAMDRNQSMFVAWTDLRNGDPDIFAQFYYASNDSMGPDFKVNADAGNFLQVSADVALSRNDAYLTWVDNRLPANGADIFAKLVPYNGVDVRTRDEETSSLPKDFALLANFPNPFNATTEIKFDIETAGSKPVSLKVYNVKGELVRTLVQERLNPGYYRVVWDGTNQSGGKVASGVYFYQLKAGELSRTRKMTLLK